MSVKRKKEMLAEFTKDELDEMQDAFSLFDRDNDGHITFDELNHVMKALGRSPSSTELRSLFDKADLDGNGEIEFEEFVQMVGNDVKKPVSQEDFVRAFKAFDVDGDGFITVVELHSVLNSVEEGFPESVARELLAEADTDGDGQISVNEFIDYMNKQAEKDRKASHT